MAFLSMILSSYPRYQSIKKNDMKLWDKGYRIDKLIEDFTTKEDKKLDLLLAKYDVEGSVAHAHMLHSIGYLSASELEAIDAALANIENEISNGQFIIEEGVEDVHSQVELMLIRSIGDTGKKIHLGRSRNDQILLDQRLFFRDQLGQIQTKILNLAENLINLSDKHADDLMPGYTHMQIAMISSFGLWFGAYAESLLEDAEFTKNTKNQINKNPLGTAAGFGSSIPLDRLKTTVDLGFNEISVNSLFAQMARGKTELMVSYVISQIAFTIGKLAMDICHYSGQNFGFMKLSDEFTTGSSIMPHKKNPDVFELIRANSNHLTTLPQQLQSVLGNLTSGYHRDFQLLKEIIFPAIEKLHSVLDLTSHAIAKLNIYPPDLSEEKYQYLYSVEVVNEMVKKGVPFRDAYKKVGILIANDEFEALTELDHSHIGSIGNLGNDILRKRLEKLVLWERSS